MKAACCHSRSQSNLIERILLLSFFPLSDGQFERRGDTVAEKIVCIGRHNWQELIFQ